MHHFDHVLRPERIMRRVLASILYWFYVRVKPRTSDGFSVVDLSKLRNPWEVVRYLLRDEGSWEMATIRHGWYEGYHHPPTGTAFYTRADRSISGRYYKTVIVVGGVKVESASRMRYWLTKRIEARLAYQIAADGVADYTRQYYERKLAEYESTTITP